MDQRERKLHALHRQLNRLQRKLKALDAINDRFVLWRTIAFLLGAAAVFFGLAIQDYALTVILFIIASIVFGVLVYFHRHVKTTIAQFKVWQMIKRHHIARMTLNWEKLPPPLLGALPEDHPFVLDLDMMGWRSIHHLVDTSISIGGSQRLFNWLLTMEPNQDDILKRQALLEELIPLSMLRDRLAMNAFLAQTKSVGRWRGDRIVGWLKNTNPHTEGFGKALPVLMGLTIINFGSFLLTELIDTPPIWIVSWSMYLLLSTLQWQYLAGAFDDGLVLLGELRQFGAILSELETYNYGERTRLEKLCQPITASGEQPSKQLRGVSRLVGALSLQRNPVIWFGLNMLIPWDIFFAYQLEKRKQTLAKVVPQWLDVWYELESLNSLANFANLNPDYTFPQVKTDSSIVFEGKSLGHPLIKQDEKVVNDFTLNHIGQTVILTGSNMSGKSSFLRTLGVNLRLAYAGGVVNADSMTVGHFRVFTSIKVSDSLADGFSYFYAEVRRLKQLLEALQDDNPVPLFFLIDEIFRGTNNRERLIGSRSYIRALVDANGAGLIATHDLELVKLEDESPLISNYHFREDVVDGKISFDYTLRTGPCPTTNALKIMALEGLPVDEI